MSTTRHCSTPRRIALCSLVIGVLGWPLAGMSATTQGYVTSSSGSMVRNGTGRCVTTTSWSATHAVAECNPELVKAAPPVAKAEMAKLEEAPPKKVLEKITLDAKTLFGFDRSTLTPEAENTLRQLGQQIRSLHEVSDVVVEGYADRIGPAQYNQKLSGRRAAAVGTFLSAQGGIPEDHIKIVAKGASNPVSKCAAMKGSALIQCLQPNRRVEIRVLGVQERTE